MMRGRPPRLPLLVLAIHRGAVGRADPHLHLGGAASPALDPAAGE
jgi:hypothetical protein